MKIFRIIILGFFAVSFYSFTIYQVPVPSAKQVKKDKKTIAAGEEIYNVKCRSCHENTEIVIGQKPYDVAKTTLASMVKMAGLNKDDVGKVSAYVYFITKK